MMIEQSPLTEGVGGGKERGGGGSKEWLKGKSVSGEGDGWIGMMYISAKHNQYSDSVGLTVLITL